MGIKRIEYISNEYLSTRTAVANISERSETAMVRSCGGTPEEDVVMRTWMWDDTTR